MQLLNLEFQSGYARTVNNANLIETLRLIRNIGDSVQYVLFRLQGFGNQYGNRSCIYICIFSACNNCLFAFFCVESVMGEYLPEPAIAAAPMTVAEALLFADNNKQVRRRQDQALLTLADEVRRLRGELDKIAKAAGHLGEFILEQAG